MSCQMSGDSMTGGDIRQVTRDNMVNVSTLSESTSSDTGRCQVIACRCQVIIRQVLTHQEITC